MGGAPPAEPGPLGAASRVCPALAPAFVACWDAGRAPALPATGRVEPTALPVVDVLVPVLTGTDEAGGDETETVTWGAGAGPGARTVTGGGVAGKGSRTVTGGTGAGKGTRTVTGGGGAGRGTDTVTGGSGAGTGTETVMGGGGAGTGSETVTGGAGTDRPGSPLAKA